MDGELTLISMTAAPNDILVMEPTETMQSVLCDVRSVSRSEWESAGRDGHKAELVATMPYVNYCGQPEAIWRGNRYAVYRTRTTVDGWDVELYLEQKVGSSYVSEG